MHESLLLLERLHAVDAELDAARGELRTMQREIEQTRARLASTADELADLDTRRQVLVDQENELQGRIDKYVRRRDRTRSQLDQGLITDILVAQRQLENFAGIIDELELEELDCMERRETLEHKRDAVAQRQRLLRSRLESQQQALEQRRAALAPRMGELEGQRPDRTAGLPPHLLTEYEDIRRSHADAVVPLQEGACSACHMHHPPQVVLEVRRGSRIHHCRGCHRFLCGVVEPPAEADEVAAEGE